jgi:HPt (histidine-containing phosphotransfer) domain-containing protein
MSALAEEVGAGIAALEAELGAEAVLELIRLYTADARQLVDAMCTGAADGDADGLRRAAHTLKSTSATLGATTLAAHCKAVEDLARAGEPGQAAALVPAAAECCAEVLDALAQENARRGS